LQIWHLLQAPFVSFPETKILLVQGAARWKKKELFVWFELRTPNYFTFRHRDWLGVQP